ncbi:uncharacterized protein LOC105663008 [Megachile rotundata]|uniref:uncharacterized protein LOC105663008 n=1 Tax=Megachile rotundata TaxID=143995 RepID=UPI000614F62D|nr:PREDICTED: uncharacterized protein LOC105663008 [Megachile rotundata]
MSVQICCRDQRKMGQVIDQVKMLANNLDELRSEIDALKINYLKKDSVGQIDNTKNMFKKFKRYVRKITSINSMKNGRADGQEAYYTCSNTDPPVPSLLNYIFRIGKREDMCQIPTRVKYLRNEGNQTEVKFEDLENLKSGEQFTKYGATKNKIFQKECSDISCELDSRETPFSSNINLPSNLPTNGSKSSQNMETSNIDKQTASTQTTLPKLKRNRKTMKLQSKHPNLYLSKIKNAVITKKIIKSSNESTFTVCSSDYPKKFNEQRSRDKKRKNNYTETVDGIDDKLSVDKIMKRLKDVSYDNSTQGSFSSVSVDLELNISDSSNKIDEFTERRKPRTYVVHKKKREEDDWNHFEKSVIYVGPTSDLTLSSDSFLD